MTTLFDLNPQAPAATTAAGRPLPDHGTYSRYRRHGCRCTTCIDGHRSYRLRYNYERTNGQRRSIDSTQTRAHIERLLARGWKQKQIAAAAGLEKSTVSNLLARTNGRVYRATAVAILAIHLDQTPPLPSNPSARVRPVGTQRRLRALVVLGYTMPQLASELGVSYVSLHQIADGRWSSVRAGTAAAVAGLYRRLSTSPAPPSRAGEQARNYAMERGWHGPFAWDDIDDPACEPELCEVAGPQHVHPDDVAELAGRGLDDREIGRRLEVSDRTILRARLAHGIPAGVAA